MQEKISKKNEIKEMKLFKSRKLQRRFNAISKVTKEIYVIVLQEFMIN